MDVIPFVGHVKIILTGRVRVVNGLFEDMLLVEIEKDIPPTTSENSPLIQIDTFTLRCTAFSDFARNGGAV